MGSWNETCGLTSSAILEGEDVVALVVRKDIEGEWHLYGVPLYGTYGGYGNVKLKPSQQYKYSLFPQVHEDMDAFLKSAITKNGVDKYTKKIIVEDVDILFVKAPVFSKMVAYFEKTTSDDGVLPIIPGGLITYREHIEKIVTPYLLRGKGFVSSLPLEEQVKQMEEEQWADIHLRHILLNFKPLNKAQIIQVVDMAIVELMFECLRKPLTPGVMRGSQSENHMHLLKLKEVSEICHIFNPEEIDY